MYLYEFDSGETDWVLANNEFEAYDILVDELDYEESLDEINFRIVPDSELSILKFSDPYGNDCSFKERIETLSNVPQYFAGTMFT